MNSKQNSLPPSLNGSIKDGGKAPLSPVSSYQGGSDRRLSTYSVDSIAGDKQLFPDQEEQLTKWQK